MNWTPLPEIRGMGTEGTFSLSSKLSSENPLNFERVDLLHRKMEQVNPNLDGPRLTTLSNEVGPNLDRLIGANPRPSKMAAAWGLPKIGDILKI